MKCYRNNIYYTSIKVCGKDSHESSIIIESSIDESMTRLQVTTLPLIFLLAAVINLKADDAVQIVNFTTNLCIAKVGICMLFSGDVKQKRKN